MNVTITTDLLNSIFNKSNETFFDGKLPKPTFIVSNTRKTLGQYCCRYGRHFIKVTKYYKVGMLEVETTMIHEMIHLWQKVTFGHSDHLTTFRQKAREVLHKSNGKYDIKRCSSRKGYEPTDPNKASKLIKNKI